MPRPGLRGLSRSHRAGHSLVEVSDRSSVGGGTIHLEPRESRLRTLFDFGPKTTACHGSSGDGFRIIPWSQSLARPAVNETKPKPS